MAEDKRQLYKSLGFLSSVGISLVVSILIGLAMGVYLDRWLETGPLFTLIMLLIGVISGFRNVYILTTRELKRQELEDGKASDDHDASG
ncbi:MAG: AtpZ/AtpI family protein [Desulfuromusa sp.]|jgi:ATP synthase protein I|nr:AtpZ/AtpI family protein [Desulfuromusa sp.]